MTVIRALKLTASTISACYNYGNGVKNASREKKQIINQLFGLQKVLEDVRTLVEDEEGIASSCFPEDGGAVADSRLPALVKLLNNREGLDRCLSELEILKEKLIPKGGWTDRTQALIWPFKQGDLKKTLDHLAQFQNLLSSALVVDQTYVAPSYL